MRRLLAVAACLVLLEMLVLGQVERPLLLRHPTLSGTQIVFSFAGDLWIVSRDGGDARRLTSGVGVESDPFFSPDGTQVAFTGESRRQPGRLRHPSTSAACRETS